MTSQPYYETMYILRPDIPEEDVEQHLKKYSDLVKESGAEVLDSQMRGKRRLAYPIAKHKEGIYVQLSHKGDGQQVEKLEKAMRIGEDVIRYMTVKQYGPLPTPRVSSAQEITTKKENKDTEKEKDIDKKKSKDTEKEKDVDKKKSKDTEKEKDIDKNKDKDAEKELSQKATKTNKVEQ